MMNMILFFLGVALGAALVDGVRAAGAGAGRRDEVAAGAEARGGGGGGVNPLVVRNWVSREAPGGKRAAKP